MVTVEVAMSAVVRIFTGVWVVATFGKKILVKVSAMEVGLETLLIAVLLTGRAGNWRLIAHTPTITDSKASAAQNVAWRFFDITLELKFLSVLDLLSS